MFIKAARPQPESNHEYDRELKNYIINTSNIYEMKFSSIFLTIYYILVGQTYLRSLYSSVAEHWSCKPGVESSILSGGSEQIINFTVSIIHTQSMHLQCVQS